MKSSLTRICYCLRFSIFRSFFPIFRSSNKLPFVSPKTLPLKDWRVPSSHEIVWDVTEYYKWTHFFRLYV